MYFVRAILASVCLGAVACLTALASPTLYTTTGTFTPASAGLIPGSPVDFNSFTSDQHFTASSWPTLGGVQFQGGAATNPDLWVKHLTGASQFRLPSGTQTSSLLMGPKGEWVGSVWESGYIMVLLPEGVRAISGYVAVVDNSNSDLVDSVAFKVNDSASLGSVSTVTGRYLSFFGVTSDTDISVLRIYAQGTGPRYALLDNFQLYTTDAPEADTWILACSGLILVLVGARAQRAKPRLSRVRLSLR